MATSRATDERWMRRAIGLAMRGRGEVEPNPMVGCVLVRGGRVIGEGYHQRFGGPHAEPNALASCAGGARGAAGATAYVNLEPCCHTKKKTPPCVPALIAAGVKRVVIGCLDPNPRVGGRGVKQLRAAGILVDTGVLEEEALQLNAAYMANVVYRRPYVTLKWAESADGRVAGPGGVRRTISNKTSLGVMHGLRARSEAIMVGLRTALMDDPLLTPRRVPVRRMPLRVVLDSELRFQTHLQLARTAAQGPVLIYCTPKNFRAKGIFVKLLAARNITVVPVAADGERVSLAAVCADLHRRGVAHLLVEPGPRLARAFFRANLADRVWVFRSGSRMNEKSAPAAAAVRYPPVASIRLDDDRLTEYLNPSSPVYFGGERSVDCAYARERRFFERPFLSARAKTNPRSRMMGTGDS
jgi:diaminohydroxyphosphoribosylaminopyrimidine deaminase / 5-amino-6-(5-phosphoribosylamino)uracil reductase